MKMGTTFVGSRPRDPRLRSSSRATGTSGKTPAAVNAAAITHRDRRILFLAHQDAVLSMHRDTDRGPGSRQATSSGSRDATATRSRQQLSGNDEEQVPSLLAKRASRRLSRAGGGSSGRTGEAQI